MLSNNVKRFLSFLMAFVMLLSVMPVSAWAAGEDSHDHSHESEEQAAQTQETIPAENAAQGEANAENAGAESSGEEESNEDDAAQEDVGEETPDAADIPVPNNTEIERFQGMIDEILGKYLDETVKTAEDVPAAVDAKTDEACEDAWWDIMSLEEEIMFAQNDGLVTEAELEWLLKANPIMAAFADVVIPRAEATMPSRSVFKEDTFGTYLKITDTENNSTLSGTTYTAKAAGGWFNKATNTITLTNTNTVDMKLTLSYSVASANEFKIDNASADSSGTISKFLKPQETVVFYIKSNSGLSGTTVTLTLSNLEFIEVATESDITFAFDGTLGSVTVDGTAVADGEVKTIAATGATLVAAPTSGVIFLGWVDGNYKILSTDASYILEPATDMTVQPVFASADTTARFKVGSGMLFNDLNAAVVYAQNSSDKVIVLAHDGTLPAGNYTIPTGVKLLIPFSASDTGDFKEKPDNGIGETTGISNYDKNGITGRNYAFRTLKVASGAKITCSGEICVNGQRQNDSQPYTGVSLGGHGRIHLLGSGDQLIMANGSKLWCYGYIIGSGMVNVQKGAQITELMQMACWPGGGNFTNWDDKDDKSTLFLISQYYIQNVEAPLKLNAGATAYVDGVLNISLIGEVKANLPYAGTSGLFVLQDGASVIRTYDASTDRITYEQYGTINLGSMEISEFGVSLNSGNNVMPLGSNMTLKLMDGAKMTMDKRIAILPGAEIVVSKGATLDVTGEIYVVDKSDYTKDHFFNRTGITLKSGHSFTTVGKSPNFAPLPYIASNNGLSARVSKLVRGSTTTDGKTTQRIYTNIKALAPSGKLTNNGTVNVTGNGLIATTSKNSNSDKAIVGDGVINYSVAPSVGTLKFGVSSIAQVTTSNALANLAGVGTLKTLSQGTYYGQGDGYWYQHAVTVSGDASLFTVVDSNGVAASALSSYDKRTVNGTVIAVAANGGSVSFEMAADKVPAISGAYGSVSAKPGSTDGTICYTISNVTGDVTLSVSAGTKTTVVTVAKNANNAVFGTAQVEFPADATLAGYYTDKNCGTAASNENLGGTVYIQAPVDAVAAIGPDKGSYTYAYMTIADAVAAATGENDYVTVLQDRTLAKKIVIGDGADFNQNITLDLGGKTITGSTSTANEPLTNNAGSTLRLINGTISYGAKATSSAAAATVRNKGIIEYIENVTLLHTNTGSQHYAHVLKNEKGATIKEFRSGEIRTPGQSVGYPIYNAGTINTIGTSGNTVTLYGRRGIEMTSTGVVDTVAATGSTVNITGGQHGIDVVAGAKITTIGAEGSTINFYTGGMAMNKFCINVAGTVTTIAAEGCKMTFDMEPAKDQGYATYGINLGSGGKVTYIGKAGSEITITGKTANDKKNDYATNLFGIRVNNGEVTNLGAKATDKYSASKLTIDLTHSGLYGSVYGIHVVGSKGKITNLGADGATISISVAYTGTDTEKRAYGILNEKTISTLGHANAHIEVISNQYGIRNTGTITSMAGVTVISTDTTGSYYGLSNAGTITTLSSGNFYHASGRANAVNNTGTLAYPTGKALSETAKSVTLLDGTTKECFYVANSHTHAYPEKPTFTWTPKDGGGYTVTANLTCGNANCPDQPFSGTATVTSVTTNPTCTAAGKIVYTATVNLNGKDYTDTKTDSIAATGHTYADPVVEFAADGKTYTVTVTCSACTNEEGRVKTSNALDSKQTGSTAGNCQTISTVTYTAAGEFEGVSYTATETVDGALGAHNLVKTDAVDPTCTKVGNNEYYTCSTEGCGKVFKADQTTETTVEKEQLAAKGHSYTNPVVVFAEDGKTYTVTVTCSACTDEEGRVKTSNALDSKQTGSTAGDCQTKSTVTYTAAGEFEGVSYTATETVDGALGAHSLTFQAEVPATCTEDGTVAHYHCSICGKNFNDENGTTELTDLAIAHQGHKWNAATPNAPKTCSVCGATEGEMLAAEASINGFRYATLAEAIAAAKNGETIVLESDVQGAASFAPIVLPAGVTLNLNGKSLTGTAAGRIEMAGGMLYTYADDNTTIIPMAGPANAMYITTDAVFVLGTDWRMTVESGTATLGADWRTMPGQTVIIASGAAVTIPENLTFTVLGNVVVNGTLTNNGSIVLGAENATVTAAEGIAVSTTVENAKVVYENGKYSVHVHNFEAIVSAPTCEDAGFTTYTCACGESYKGNEVAALGHTWVDASFDNPKTCSVCGATEGAALVAVAQVNGQKYQTLREAVEAAESGATVELLGNFSGAGVVINKDITIDFGGYTYSFTEGVGSTGTESNGFQILTGNTVVLKNGTLNVAETARDKFYILVQNYANLTVKDMTLDGTNLDKWSGTDGDSYVLSNNSGTVRIDGNTSIRANDDGELAVAVDACKYGSYAAPSVTIDTTGTVSGTVEVTGGSLTVDNGTFNVEGTECFDVFVCSSGTLTINNGIVTGGSKNQSTAVWAKANGNVTINGGSFTISAEEGDYNDLIYARDNAVIYVNGGHYSGVYSEKLGSNFLLNLKNGSDAKITVTGGTFVGFNPGNTNTEPDGDNNFCAEGYGPTDNGDGTYGVHKHVDAEAVVENNVDPTCTAEGSYDSVVYCSVCKAELSRETVTTEKAAHQLKETPASNATCTENGNSAYWTCSVCGKFFSDEGTTEIEKDSWIIASEGHELTDVEAKAATCTEDGYTAHKACTVEGCGYKEDYEVIPAAHDPKAVEAKAASCYAEGNIAYWTCENCDVLFADEACTQETTAEAVKLKTLAHTWGEGVVTEEATCTTTGLMEYECTVEECTATKTEVIDALNHSGVTAETKWDSDETNHWKTCPDCGESVQSGEHNYVDGKCSICGVDDSTTENPYVITQTAQLWLIEPWALRANMRLYHPSTDGMSAYGAILTKDEFEENIQDYGVFFIRESDLDKPVEDLTVEDIINHPNAIHKTKADGGVKYDAAEGKLYSDFDEGIYTYEFKDSVIVLYYFVERGNTHYATIRERNLSEMVNKNKTDTKNYPDADEREVYAQMAELEKNILAYRAQFGDNPEALPIMDVPTLGEMNLSYSKMTTTALGYTQAVVLIEPWGLELNGRVISGTSTVDLVNCEDYGVIVFYDTDKTASITSVGELLSMSDAYVFSKKNGNVTIDTNNKIAAVYNSGIYTYQMDEKAYYVYYFLDEDTGTMTCGSLRTCSILDAIAARQKKNPDTLENSVYESMKALYVAITEYRAARGANN